MYRNTSMENILLVLLYCDIYKCHSVANRHTSPSLFHLHSVMITSSPQVAIRFVCVTPASWTQMDFKQVKVKAIMCTTSFHFLLFWYKEKKAKEVQTQYWAALSWCQELCCHRTSFKVNVEFHFFLVSFRWDYDHELKLSLHCSPWNTVPTLLTFFL